MARITNNPDRLVVGLTGGIGAGKSTASNMFEKLGVQIVDADAISRQATKKGQPAWQKILETFEGVQSPDGEIDRNALAQRVFSNQAELAQLESIVQPEVSKQIDLQLSLKLGHYAILDSPLLLEKSGDASRIDRVLVVDAPEEVQLQRAVDRTRTQLEASGHIVTIKEAEDIREDIKNRMANQLSRSARLELADDVVDNSRGADFLRNQVYNLHFCYYLPLAFAKSPDKKKEPA